ncbi:hypothetical protein MtrunA17_Chr7g0259751 [Medicago truncatula]|uniref:Uncharacterized protein n=1 Tax=Medicago truncatula TaxID=3880 RepID=A0A396H446_MEDTR|nr:hypothetical protein MtrunA17_Chr7g0259751 [Medicago truncatula]
MYSNINLVLKLMLISAAKDQTDVQNLQRTNSINVSCMVGGPIAVFNLHIYSSK